MVFFCNVRPQAPSAMHFYIYLKCMYILQSSSSKRCSRSAGLCFVDLAYDNSVLGIKIVFCIAAILLHLLQLEQRHLLSFPYRPSLGLHYSAVKPLKIVYGRGQYLYDECDQPYLDCINNVTHGMFVRCNYCTSQFTIT